MHKYRNFIKIIPVTTFNSPRAFSLKQQISRWSFHRQGQMCKVVPALKLHFFLLHPCLCSNITRVTDTFNPQNSPNNTRLYELSLGCRVINHSLTSNNLLRNYPQIRQWRKGFRFFLYHVWWVPKHNLTKYESYHGSCPELWMVLNLRLVFF